VSRLRNSLRALLRFIGQESILDDREHLENLCKDFLDDWGLWFGPITLLPLDGSTVAELTTVAQLFAK
jgi:hypothetical protein